MILHLLSLFLPMIMAQSTPITETLFLPLIVSPPTFPEVIEPATEHTMYLNAPVWRLEYNEWIVVTVFEEEFTFENPDVREVCGPSNSAIHFVYLDQGMTTMCSIPIKVNADGTLTAIIQGVEIPL